MNIKIPLEIQCEIQNVGGIKALKRMLPDNKVATEVAKTGQGLSDPTRIKILNLLQSQPLCVCVIKKVLGISDSKLSYHLSILNDCGLTTKKRDRKFNIYSLTRFGRRLIKIMMLKASKK